MGRYAFFINLLNKNYSVATFDCTTMTLEKLFCKPDTHYVEDIVSE